MHATRSTRCQTRVTRLDSAEAQRFLRDRSSVLLSVRPSVSHLVNILKTNEPILLQTGNDMKQRIWGVRKSKVIALFLSFIKNDLNTVA